jgi:C4-dicarboxylate-specific signal transduction histidine kinase
MKIVLVLTAALTTSIGLFSAPAFADGNQIRANFLNQYQANIGQSNVPGHDVAYAQFLNANDKIKIELVNDGIDNCRMMAAGVSMKTLTEEIGETADQERALKGQAADVTKAQKLAILGAAHSAICPQHK